MLNHEYVPFQYVVVYIAVLQVSPSKAQYLAMNRELRSDP